MPRAAIPCSVCRSEFLLGRDGLPECGLGTECQLYAFVQKALEPWGEREWPRVQRELCMYFDASYQEDEASHGKDKAEQPPASPSPATPVKRKERGTLDSFQR